LLRSVAETAGVISRLGVRPVLAALTAVALLPVAAARTPLTAAQGPGRGQPGASIGTVTTRGDLIVMTLDDGALGTANLFDLVGRTLRFTPDGGGYRVENVPLEWDVDFGPAMTGAQAPLADFAFPFSGRTWGQMTVGVAGTIGFDAAAANSAAAGAAAGAGPPTTPFPARPGGAGAGGRAGGRAGGGPAGGGRGGAVQIGRFDQLQQAARTLVNTVPALCVFLKPRMTGTRYLKPLADRVVVTWSLTEPAGGIQDFTWVPTVNRFQAVLHKDGGIDFSYQDVAAKDAIVGVYPIVPADTLAAAPPAETDLSKLTRKDGPFPVVYESFHYLALPQMRDLACTVIKALGDKFDFLAYYSDFRVDNQEAGTPSNGPLGGGPDGGAVTGIGATQRGLESYCSQGRFQWAFIQPVYAGANQMQERPPDGVTDANTHDILAYAHQIGERTPDGRLLPYDYAMSQIGHEMGHRWGAFVSARVSGETIPLGPTHWARGLQAPAAFPFQRPIEASAMGGGVWQDNDDGTFTQLDDDYYVPATGYSYLDLYLMGLIGPSEVPDFFILRNLVAAGRDANGHPIFKADRTKVTIQDVIAAEGPRLPDVDHAQKRFNTGMVVIVEHGKTPSRELLERTTGIAAAWSDYFATVTGHRASMTTSVR